LVLVAESAYNVFFPLSLASILDISKTSIYLIYTAVP
jgi:hypothetical protein